MPGFGIPELSPGSHHFFVRVSDEKEEQAAAEKAVGKEEFQGEWTAPQADFAQPEVADWSEGVPVPSVPIQPFPAAGEGKAPLTMMCVWCATLFLFVQVCGLTGFVFCPGAPAKAPAATEGFSGKSRW